MDRTPPHRRFSRRSDDQRLFEEDVPPTALLRITPRGRAALALLRARAAAEYRPLIDDSLDDEFDHDDEGET
jgi:hypothetical protein